MYDSENSLPQASIGELNSSSSLVLTEVNALKITLRVEHLQVQVTCISQLQATC